VLVCSRENVRVCLPIAPVSMCVCVCVCVFVCTRIIDE